MFPGVVSASLYAYIDCTGGKQQRRLHQPRQTGQAAPGAYLQQLPAADQEEEWGSKEEAAGGLGRADCSGCAVAAAAEDAEA